MAWVMGRTYVLSNKWIKLCNQWCGLKKKVYSISAVNQIVFFYAYQLIDGGKVDWKPFVLQGENKLEI